jgi:hypothetical protein
LTSGHDVENRSCRKVTALGPGSDDKLRPTGGRIRDR